ncbi:hypothetical protein AQUCO_03800194v1 [Aquilegia coerulea]|uniref:Transcription factor MYC/MYB N-terminal domain-containing protein n=1 Tax=Aquilegia coerulea TaxID=218851 RepID=A0A2G5CT05_AQUCA|nr:hypothetical protein AQUCO_03800194v1 [Aquilegia coerulea]
MVVMLGNQLGKMLAASVRSFQWSYAIFWSPSTKQEGVLEWSDGYFNVDKVDLKKSEKLREMYERLSLGETKEQAKIASTTSLSPEDLSDVEWYYVVCMSFAFAPGEGLPGRAFLNGEHIWLCNAQHADSKIFNRSLLAKTVVCFPVSGGVVELGVTHMVIEDIGLVQQMKAFFLDFSKDSCSEKFMSSPPNDEDDESLACDNDHDADNTQKRTRSKSGLRDADISMPGFIFILTSSSLVASN